MVALEHSIILGTPPQRHELEKYPGEHLTIPVSPVSHGAERPSSGFSSSSLAACAWIPPVTGTHYLS